MNETKLIIYGKGLYYKTKLVYYRDKFYADYDSVFYFTKKLMGKL